MYLHSSICVGVDVVGYVQIVTVLVVGIVVVVVLTAADSSSHC